MKKTISTLLFCSLALGVFAQFADNWHHNYQSTPSLNYSTEGRRMIVDNSSNVFVLSDNSSDRDSVGQLSANTLYSVRLQKFDFAGNLLNWRYINVGGLITNGYDNRSGFGIDLDASGNVYIGYSILNQNGNFDIVLRKFSNTLGNVWTYVYTTPNNDQGIDLKVTGNTVIALIKSYNSSGTSVTYSLLSTQNGGSNVTIPFYSFGANVDVANALAISNKDIYVTGYTLTSGIKSVMTARIGASGLLKWKVNFNSGTASSGDDYGKGIIIGTDGYIYDMATSYTSAANGNDGLLLRYSSAGVLASTLRLNATLVDEGGVVVQGPSGYVFAVCSNASSVRVYKVLTTGPQMSITLNTSYAPIPSSSYTSITNVTVSDAKVATSGNVYVCGGVNANSASGNFTASYLVKIGLNGFVFAPLNSNSVEGNNASNFLPVCMRLDGLKTDILLLRNTWQPYATHTTEQYLITDYEGGASLRLSSNQNETSAANGINIFPNPATNQITIQNSTGINTIEIYNMDGRLVNSQVLNTSNQATVNLSNLNTGLYMCRVTSLNGAVSVTKLTIK